MKTWVGVEVNYEQNNLDVFRVIATVQVFLGHLISHFIFPREPSFFMVYFLRGVPILFALCGFFAAMSFERAQLRGGGVKNYLLGRARRILPEFWACIVLNTVVILSVYSTRPRFIEGIVYCVTQFFGLNFYTGEWLRGYGVGTPNGVLWTIPVQIQFFFFVPFLSRLLKGLSLGKSISVVGLLAIISIVSMRASLHMPLIVGKLVGVTVVPYLYFLVLGMIFFRHRERLVSCVRKYRYLILLTYVAWRVFQEFFQFPHFFDGVLYNTISTLLLTFLVFSFGFIGTWHLKFDLTYGFYLYHMVIINLVIHFGVVGFNSSLQCVFIVGGILGATLVCAYLSTCFGRRFYKNGYICLS